MAPQCLAPSSRRASNETAGVEHRLTSPDPEPLTSATGDSPGRLTAGASVRSSDHEHSARRPGQSPQSSRCGRSVTWYRASSTPRASETTCSARASASAAREAADDRLARALEEAVRDVHARGAVAQRGERVDGALGRVVAVDDLGRVGAVQAVGLVVDDQRARRRARWRSRRRSR